LCALALVVGATLGHGLWLEKSFYIPDSLCGLSQATCAVYNPVDNRVYVGGKGPFVSVIDGSALRKVARIDVPDSLRTLVLNSTGTKLYGIVAGGGITVIDLVSGSVRGVVSVGRSPTALCYSSELERLFCADYLDRLVYVIDCTADTVVATVPAGYGSLALCFDTTGTKLYCANQRTNDLSVIDAVGDSLLKTIRIGSYPQALCCNTRRNKVYCANYRGDNVTVLDAANDSILARPITGDDPDNLCYNSVDDKVYCAGSQGGELTIICGSGDTVLARYGSLDWCQSVLHDPVNDRIYCGRAGKVAILDGATDSILMTLPVDNEYFVLVHQAAPNRVWCAGEQVVVLDADPDSVEASIPVGCYPRTSCYSSVSRKLYVGYQLGMTGYVTVIDAATSAVLRTIRVPHFRVMLCYDAATDKIYTGGAGASWLDVISCQTDSVVASIFVGMGGEGQLCSNPTDERVYFGTYDGGYVKVIDATTDSVVKSLWLEGGPNRMRYNTVNHCLYVHVDGAVAVVDSADSVVAEVRTDLPPYGGPMVINPVTSVLYDVDRVFGEVALVDCHSNRHVRTLSFGDSQCDICVNTHDNKVYLAGYGQNLWVLDGATSRLDSIWIGHTLGDVFYDAQSNHVYCASVGWAYVIDGTSNSVLDSFPAMMDISWDEDAFALDPPSSRIYALEWCTSRVVVIRDTCAIGVAEPVGRAATRPVMPTFVHGTLELPEQAGVPSCTPFALLDISGRKAADLSPGPNDIRHLAPGVYFICEARARVVRKVVVTR
jgi:YVTN family beta-propeller protein